MITSPKVQSKSTLLRPHRRLLNNCSKELLYASPRGIVLALGETLIATVYSELRVKNLKVLGSQGWTLMREGEAEKQKQYIALVWISQSLNGKNLKTTASLKDMHKHRIATGLTLTGRFEGKRVVFLKQLTSSRSSGKSLQNSIEAVRVSTMVARVPTTMVAKVVGDA
ncbi:hypothetical protein LguiB_035296 [Lonicera macranthoides]